MTPRDLAGQIVSELPLNPTSRVLEPSFGDGSFCSLVELLMALHEGSPSERLARVLTQNSGVELDESLIETHSTRPSASSASYRSSTTC